MASSTVSSRGHSPYDLDSTGGDSDGSWQLLELSSSGFLNSPGSGSFVFVGAASGSPSGLSPLYLEPDPSQYPMSLPDSGDVVSTTSVLMETSFVASGPEDQAFMTPQDYLLTDEQINEMAPFFETIPPNIPLATVESLRQPQPDLGIPQNLRSGPDVSPWSPTNVRSPGGDTASSPNLSTSSSPSQSSRRSPAAAQESDSQPRSSIRKVKGAKVEKKKSDHSGQFVIVTPSSMSARAGKPNLYECLDSMRATQKGRKGPLANEVKQSALQVRRVGACFCCQSRKVKCDEERPCKNCKKLMLQVPQVMCWQFQDFLTVLFPEFIRGHFKKEAMAKFMQDNIDGFNLPCTVELFSGLRFSTTLKVRAKFFNPRTEELLKHWHMHVGSDRINMHSRGSVPIGLDVDGNSQRDELKKLAKEYIQSIIREPEYAEQTTDSFQHTELPTKILRIIHEFSKRCDSPIVRRSLGIYAMHYVMTRHLCMTRQSILSLQHTNVVPLDAPWVTPRMLNRQIKAVVDELLMRDMQHLFDNFSKLLKLKSRREWAPCLAAFLVLCLYMEALETAADNFVISQNEINLRNHYAPEFQRKFALDVCNEVEHLPFKQLAYQFHQIYQTHSKDASAKPFNPLGDEFPAEQGELDGAAIEMVTELRRLIHGASHTELEFLTMDPILPNQENHPFPRDVSLNYTGRLVSKFLLSFIDEKFLFEPTS